MLYMSSTCKLSSSEGKSNFCKQMLNYKQQVHLFYAVTVKRSYTLAGFSLVHKNVHFDPFLPPMTPKTVHRGDNDVPQSSQIFMFPEVNVP